MSQRGGAVVIPTSTLRRAILLLAALVVIALIAYYGRTLISRAPAGAEQIDRGAYQVVFLTTGQSFFGKLTIADMETYLLSDVYYLIANDSSQRLVKRGTEVFGPRDPMVILAKQVLFFENLRDDSDIVVGIRAIKSGQGGAAPVVPTAVPATAPATATVRPSATR